MLPKNLIADPSCKVSNGKGFRGTCPLPSPCTLIEEMEKPSLRLKYGSIFSLVYRRDRALSFIYAAGRGRRRGRTCEEFNS
jgi:hypothetical protein